MSHDDRSSTELCTGQLLLVGEEDLTRLLGETLEEDGHRCDRAGCVREARRRVLESRYDAIVLDVDTLAGGAIEVVQLVSRLAPATTCVLRSRTISIDTVLSAMRAGLGDFLGGTLSVPQIRLRLRAAVRRSRETQQRFERMAQFEANRRELTTDALADHAANATHPPPLDHDARERGATERADAERTTNEDGPPQESSLGASDSGPADFAEAASAELDPEGLVTAAVEHLVRELGPVNTAIYLGTGSAKFGLVAYARADLPRTLIESMLSRWSSTVCVNAALDGKPTIHLDATLLLDEHGAPNGGVPAHHPLANRGAIVVPCRFEGVCDAVVVVLTPSGVWPLDAAAIRLSEFGRIFGQQLARIQRIHSRHRPWWPVEDD